MQPTIPWYQSAIVRQQIVAFIVAAFGLLHYAAKFDVDATVTAVLAGVAALVPIWTIFTRLFKPTPAITQTAIDKHEELVAEKKLAPVAIGTQGGFFRLSLAVFLSLFAAGVLALLPGCVGTTAAYKAATTLPDYAYVVEEHYSAVLKEAADISQLPTTDAAVKNALKAADNAVRPFILGDPATGKPSLRELAGKYQAVRDAKTQADLQAALDAAVIELTKLINAVKTARS